MTAADWQRQLQDWQESGDFFQLLPEIAALEGIPQPADYHAEGDVLTHTLMAVDTIRPEADERVFWAVLLHDIGKATSTEFIAGRWRSRGHVRQGTLLAPQILARLGLSRLAEDVSWLVKHHHFALDWGDFVIKGLTDRQKRFCTLPLFPLLIEVCRADAEASIGGSDKGKRLERILAQLSEKGGKIND